MRRVAAPKKKETVVQTERDRVVPREGGGGVKTPHRLLRFVYLQCNWQTLPLPSPITPPPSA